MVVATESPERTFRSTGFSPVRFNSGCRKWGLLIERRQSAPRARLLSWQSLLMSAATAERSKTSTAIQTLQCGRRLELERCVHTSNGSEVFPCPFCRSGALLLIGGTRRFLYYSCGECSEIWTAADAEPSTPGTTQRFEAAMTTGTRH